jgi:hypothetical protein
MFAAEIRIFGIVIAGWKPQLIGRKTPQLREKGQLPLNLIFFVAGVYDFFDRHLPAPNLHLPGHGLSIVVRRSASAHQYDRNKQGEDRPEFSEWSRHCN